MAMFVLYDKGIIPYGSLGLLRKTKNWFYIVPNLL